MKSKYYLTLADAEFLMEEAQKYAIEHNFKGKRPLNPIPIF